MVSPLAEEPVSSKKTNVKPKYSPVLLYMFTTLSIWFYVPHHTHNVETEDDFRKVNCDQNVTTTVVSYCVIFSDIVEGWGV